MHRDEYRDQLDAIKFILNDARERTLEIERKKHPDLIKEKDRFNKIQAEFPRNYSMGVKAGLLGNYSQEAYQKQLADLKQNLEEKENAVIRDGCAQLRDKLVEDSFGEYPFWKEQAMREINDEPTLQWLKSPGQPEQSIKEETKSSLQNTFKKETGAPIPKLKDQFDSQNIEAPTNEPKEISLSDQFPGVDDKQKEKTETPEVHSYSIDTDAFPGYDSYFTDSFSEPDQGVHYTPDTGGKSDKSPEIDMSD